MCSILTYYNNITFGKTLIIDIRGILNFQYLLKMADLYPEEEDEKRNRLPEEHMEKVIS